MRMQVITELHMVGKQYTVTCQGMRLKHGSVRAHLLSSVNSFPSCIA